MKAKKCRVCKSEFVPTKPLQAVCGISCAIEHANKRKKVQERAAIALERAETRKAKEVLKKRSEWLKEAQIAFNAYIRERDKVARYPCISSGRALDWNGNAVDAGHYRSTGSAPHLRFNEDNCHAQSKHDNRYLAGNVAEYRIRLIRRIGIERVEALESDNTPRKWTIPELQEIKALYKRKLKELKHV